MDQHCETCTYFRRHYIKAGRGFTLIRDGHCVYPRCKPRRTDTKACGYYLAVR